MKASNELREKMWELCYDLLPDDERKSLIATIKSDPQAARLYAEVRLQADLVGFAAKVEDSSLVLSPEGQEGSKRDLAPAAARRKQSVEASRPPAVEPNRRGAWIAWLPAAAALLLVGLIGWGTYRPLTAPQVASNLIVTEVEMPGQMPEGLSSKIALRSRSLEGSPRPVEMDVKLVDARGEVLHRAIVPTDASGLATMTVPGQAVQPGVRFEAVSLPNISLQKESGSELLAEQAAADGAVPTDYLAAALPVEPQPPVFYYLPERPQSQPGEPMNFTTYNLSRFGLQMQAVDEVTNSSFYAPPQAAGMAPQLELAAREGEKLGDRFDRAPAERPFVKQLAPRQDEQQKNEARAQAEGLERLADNDKYGRSVQDLNKLYIKPSAVDTKDTETQNADIKDADIKDKALAERRPGPAPSASAPPIGDGRQAAEGQLGQKELSESGGVTFGSRGDRPAAEAAEPLVVEAGSPVPVEVPAEAAANSGQWIAKAFVRGAVVASAPISGPAAAPGGSQQKSAEAGRDLAHYLELPPEADGEVRVQLFDASQSPPQIVREQLFFRQPARQLKLALAEAKNEFQPGEAVQIRVQALNEHDQPEKAVLGVRVWSEKHIQASGQQPTMLADVVRTYSASAPHQQAEEAGELARLSRLRSLGAQVDALAMSKERDEAKKQDQLARGGAEAALAPSGPPAPAAPATTPDNGLASATPAPEAKPASPGVPAIASRGGEAGETSNLALDAGGAEADAQTYAVTIAPAMDAYVPARPLVVSNEAAVRQASQSLAAASERAWQAWQAIVGRVLVGGGIVALIGLLLLFLMRMPVRAVNGTLTLLAATASLIVGAVWIDGGPRSGVQVAAVTESPAGRSDEEVRLRDNVAAGRGSSPAATEAEVSQAGNQPLASDDLANLAPPGNARFKESDPADFARQSPADTEAASAASVAGTPPPPRATEPAAKPADPQPAGLGGDAPARDPADSSSGGLAAAPPAPDAAQPLAAGGSARRAIERRLADRPSAAAPAAQPAAPGTDGVGRDRKEAREQLAGKSPAGGVQGRLAGVEAVPASLYFNPRLATDDDGYATIEFTMPAVESDYRVLIDAFGQGRIGSGELSISCRK